MKTVKAVAAVICDSLQDKKMIFSTARGYDEFKGQWEFPGRFDYNQSDREGTGIIRLQ